MNQSSSLRIALVILCVFLVPSTSSVNLDFVKLPVDLKAFIYNQANLQHFNFDSEESKPG